ncbi:hypothetical protein OV208_15305 [Corallococcus sp. bb12-1]|uniref:hypothetical protein n=1 Tax=Corallococcus sp. bb12-1 TaxID=2996784 RepID=UPI00226F07B6|nr:hypothetical protein [Corallococcus sp. bb12-1]MCY1042691.1 hypothetical protein [Corallococcus sp. bb12-1]
MNNDQPQQGGRMEVVYFSRFTIEGLNAKSAADKYIDWVLGFGDYRRMRAGRLDAGVLRDWIKPQLIAGVTLTGRLDYEIKTRTKENLFLLHLKHRDSAADNILWRNVVRLQTIDDSVQIEHALSRSGGRSSLPLLKSLPRPRILKDLLESYGPKTLPLDIDRDATNLSPFDVRDFVKYQLLGEKREIPLVVLSPFPGNNTPLVNPKKLTEWLRGMAGVVVLKDSSTEQGWTGALTQKGFDRRFGCYGGAIRVFPPRLTPGTLLPYILPEQLLEHTESERLPIVASQISQRLIRKAMPDMFMSVVDKHDRTESVRHAQAILEMRQRGSAAIGSIQDQLHSEQARASEVESALKVLISERENQDTELKGLQSEIKDLKDQIEYRELEHLEAVSEIEIKIKHDNEAHTAALDGMQAAFSKLKASKSEQCITPELRIALEATIKTRARPVHYLTIAAELYHDRLAVLPSAWKSAKHSDAFETPEKVGELLQALAVDYHNALTSGRGDDTARQAFGRDDFAATESESVMKNKAAVKRRTFRYNENDIKMFQHLKIGVKDSPARSFRIHFHWDAEAKIIAIGHCGPHLDFS